MSHCVGCSISLKGFNKTHQENKAQFEMTFQPLWPIRVLGDYRFGFEKMSLLKARPNINAYTFLCSALVAKGRYSVISEFMKAGVHCTELLCLW